MTLIIRSVTMADLDSVVKIEAAAFKMTIAQTKKDMIGRIANYPDTFLVAEKHGQVIGHVFGPAFNERYIRDELYYQNHPNHSQDQYQTVLSLAVAPAYRRQGVATLLLNKLEKIAQSQGRQAVTLTCLPKLFSFYEECGFKNEGPTADEIPDPDGVSSYNMVKEI